MEVRYAASPRLNVFTKNAYLAHNMIIYLLATLFLFFVYYFVERNIVKRSLLKSGERAAEIFKLTTEPDINDIKPLRKNTYYYIYRPNKPAFMSLSNDKSDIPLNDLDYNGLVRFKKVLENYRNNKTSNYEFFDHKNLDISFIPFYPERIRLK